eukprot:g2161.t1
MRPGLLSYSRRTIGRTCEKSEDYAILHVWGNVSRRINTPVFENNVKTVFSNEYSFAALKLDGSISTWGDLSCGGSDPSITSNVTDIFSTRCAFAALMAGGSVQAWGHVSYGGRSPNIKSGVVTIFSTEYAFAALAADGSVKTWGDSSYGGSDPHLLHGIANIFSTRKAFVALRFDGSLKTWGDESYGGEYEYVGTGVTNIYSTAKAFAALKSDGSVVAWGDLTYGGADPGIDSGIVRIFCTEHAFAALRINGSVKVWGDTSYGGSDPNISSGVVSMFATSKAFAALMFDGSVKTWGDHLYGGDAPNIGNNIVNIFSTESAFASLKSDGSVKTWGNPASGGNGPTTLRGVINIFSSSNAFAALKLDGGIVSWGHPSYGGSDPNITNGIVRVVSSSNVFVALSCRIGYSRQNSTCRMIEVLSLRTKIAPSGTTTQLLFEAAYLVDDEFRLPYIKIINSSIFCNMTDGTSDTIGPWSTGQLSYVSDSSASFRLLVPIGFKASTNNKVCYSSSEYGVYKDLTYEGLLATTLTPPTIESLNESVAPSGETTTLHLITTQLVNDATKPYVKIVPSTTNCDDEPGTNDALGPWATGQVVYHTANAAVFVLRVPSPHPTRPTDGQAALSKNKVCFGLEPDGSFSNLGEVDTIDITCGPGQFLSHGFCAYCDHGQYSTTGMKTKCTKCSAGRFGNITGKITEETACPNICPNGMSGIMEGGTNKNEACSVEGWCSKKEKSGSFDLNFDCQMLDELRLSNGDELEITGKNIGENGVIPKIYRSDVSSNKHRLFNISQGGRLTVKFLVLEGGNVHYSGCNFNNDPSCYGGTIYITSPNAHFISYNSYIRKSYSNIGGGIFGTEGSVIQLHNTVVEDCAASVAGGAACLLAESKLSLLQGTIVRNNKAGNLHENSDNRRRRLLNNNQIVENAGGGLYCSGSAECTVNASVVSDNDASAEGGGLFCGGNSTKCKVVENSIMASNKANGTASRLHCDPSSSCESDGTLIGSACPSGTFGPRTLVNLFNESSSSKLKCTNCSYGKYSGNIYGATTESAGCSNHCGPGKYGDTLGQVYESQCKDCYVFKTSTTSYFLTESHLSLFQGKYNNKLGRHDDTIGCQNCPPGKFGDTTGQDDEAKCKVCFMGYYCEGGSSKVPCVKGKYSDQNGQSTSSGCKDCEIGYYCKGRNKKLPCPAGKYNKEPRQESGLACKICTEGHFCLGVDNHKPCPPGRYGNVNGGKNLSSSCMNICAPGKYSTIFGQRTVSNCTDCPQGTFCTSVEMLDLSVQGKQLCPSGKWGNVSGAGNITEGCANDCELGKFAMGPGKTNPDEACGDQCNAGKYINVGGEGNNTCQSCRQGRYGSVDGATSEAVGCSGVCPAGKIGYVTGKTNQNDACSLACFPGHFCPGNNLAIPCPAGTHGNMSGQTQKTLACQYSCPAGKYSKTTGATNESSCKICDVGSFCTGKSHIENCPKGRYGVAPGGYTSVSNCKLCEEGYYCHGSRSRIACPKGKFSLNVGMYNQSICRNCTIGSYCKGANNVQSCPPGRYGDQFNGVGIEVCKNCLVGYFCKGKALLELCPAGKYSKTTGATNESSCNICDVGSFCTGKSHIENCPKGRYGVAPGGYTSVSNCKLCEEGYYCHGSRSRIACPKGKFSLNVGMYNQSICRNCTIGSYCKGANNVQSCPPGRYGNISGAANEQRGCPYTCQGGRYASNSSVSRTNGIDACPNLCEMGTFGNIQEGTSQENACPYLCPPGKYGFVEGAVTEDIGCKICRKGYFCLGKMSQEACPAGKYGDQVFQPRDTCKKCEEGFFCEGKSHKQGCPSGKYNSEPDIGTPCDCSACPSGRYGNTTGASECTLCPIGRTNNQPGQSSIDSCYDLTGCPAGQQYNTISRTCEPCGKTFYNPTFIPAFGRITRVKTLRGFLKQQVDVVALDMKLFEVGLLTIDKIDKSPWTLLEIEYLFERLDSNQDGKIQEEELNSFDDRCLRCPAYGAVCEDEGTRIPDMAVGFWRKNPQHPNLDYMPYYKCLRYDACPGGNGSIPCNIGYDFESPACAYCSPDYVLMGNKCDYCPGKAQMGSTIPAVVAFLVLLIVGVFLAYLQVTLPSLSKADINLIQSSFKKRRYSKVIKNFDRELQSADQFSKEEIKEIIMQADLDGSGDISREEYELFVGKTVMVETTVFNFEGIEVMESRSGNVLIKSFNDSSPETDLQYLDKVLQIENKKITNLKSYLKQKKQVEPKLKRNIERMKNNEGVTFIVARAESLITKDSNVYDDANLKQKILSYAKENKAEAGRIVQESIQSEKENAGNSRLTISPIQRLKIVFDHIQVMCFLDVAFNVPWPESFIQLLNYFRFFSLDFLDVLGFMSCHVSADFGTLFYLHMLTIPVLIIVLAVARHLALLRQRRLGKKAKFHKQSIENHVRHLFQACLFILYAGISTRITRVYKCINIQDKWYLEADMTVECFKGPHNWMMAIATACTFVYILGIPVGQGIILYKNRNALSNRMVRQKWGSIYCDFKPGYFYFELLTLFRKFILTAGMVFISGDDAVPQVVISLFASTIWYTVLVEWLPYTDETNNWTAALLGGQMIANLTMMLALDSWYTKEKSAIVGTEYYDRFTFEFLMIATNVLSAIIGIVAFVTSSPQITGFLKHFKKKIKERAEKQRKEKADHQLAVQEELAMFYLTKGPEAAARYGYTRKDYEKFIRRSSGVMYDKSEINENSSNKDGAKTNRPSISFVGNPMMDKNGDKNGKCDSSNVSNETCEDNIEFSDDSSYDSSNSDVDDEYKSMKAWAKFYETYGANEAKKYNYTKAHYEEYLLFKKQKALKNAIEVEIDKDTKILDNFQNKL